MIRILLVDDQAIILQAIQVLLEREPDFEIVGTADNGQTAIEQAQLLKPDLLLCDIEMPGMSGIAATRVICRRLPQTKVIVLSSHADAAHLTNALRAGAKGYLLKNTGAEDLFNTIRSVHRGHSQLGPGLFEKIVARVTNPHHDAKPAVDFGKLGLSEAGFLLLLEHFDRESLPKVAIDAVKQNIAASLLIYLSRYLEEHPTSLAGLFLRGSLSEDPESALLSLRMGFREGIRQNLPPQGLLLFYQEAVRLQPHVAFAWLMEADSPWLREEGLTALLNEAKQRFGADALPYQAIVALRHIRTLQAFSHTCLSLDTSLKALQNGFNRLNAPARR